jgi:hypothetical protein
VRGEQNLPFNIYLSLILALGLQATPVSKPGSNTATLDHPVMLSGIRATSAAAIESLLTQAQASGGIISIYNSCAPPTESDFSLQRTTLRQSLDYVSHVDGSRKWVDQDGAIVVGVSLLGGAKPRRNSLLRKSTFVGRRRPQVLRIHIVTSNFEPSPMESLVYAKRPAMAHSTKPFLGAYALSGPDANLHA